MYDKNTPEKSTQPATFRLSPQMVIGLFIAVLGVLATLHNLDVLEIGRFLPWWPVFMLLFGIIYATQSGHFPGRVVGSIIFVIGGLMLLRNLGHVHFNLWTFSPLLLVLIGGSILWQALRRHQAAASPAGAESVITGVAVMGGFERACGSKDFQGGELTAFMGGCEIDLTGADIKSPQAVINTFVIWGGIDIRVPEDWTVVLEGTPIMGGFADKTQPLPGAPAKRLVIRGLAIMGGVEVKN